MTPTAICLGFMLDSVFGDPHWLWHPICAIGKFISITERWMRKAFPKTPRGECMAGICLWIIVSIVSFGIPFGILFFAQRVHLTLRFGIETLMCYQIFARRSLKEESMKVYDRLEEDDLEKARLAVSYIVGRDTKSLGAEGIRKAAIETVAENASDGVIAPMLFLFLGGAPLGFLYKAVNTMDSMIGYKNERYLHFGRFAAKMDDVFNYIPARVSAMCMIVCAKLIGQDTKNAFRIWKRDRRKHASPNSAQTESVCAGALHIQLAGNAFYFGKLYEKPFIGDADRSVNNMDIVRINQLTAVSSALSLLLFTALSCAIYFGL